MNQVSVLFFSMALWPSLLLGNETPSLEDLYNTNKASIYIDFYKEGENQNETWNTIALEINELLDYCESYPGSFVLDKIAQTLQAIQARIDSNAHENIHCMQNITLGSHIKISDVESEPPLVWLGFKTSGYDPESDYIQEIAAIITDINLNILAVHDVINMQADEAIAQIEELITFIKKHTLNKPYLCGNDRIARYRAMLKKQMPAMEALFSPVTINCFSIRMFCELWHSEIYQRLNPQSALEDVYDALEQAKFYKERYLKQ